ncbi:MAG: phosphotransferase [Myxococcales bacterium]|nr:phosphotransferase [Myxococcales bacterium]
MSLNAGPCHHLAMIQRLVLHVLLKLLLAAFMVGTWIDQRWLPKMGFPRNPSAMAADPDWCIARLKAAGALPEDAEITAFKVEPYKTNEAFRSLVATVDVHFTTASGPEIRHFLAKFAPRVNSLRDHAVYLLQENAVKEAGVYGELSADPAVATPRAWIAEVHKPSGNLCIVMDRLVDTVEISERDGCPAQKCGLAMDAFAAMHARYWNKDEATFLKVVPDPVIDYMGSLFEGDDAELFGDLIRATWRHDSLPPATVLHGDARVGNMLFPTDAPGSAFAFIDWQAARKGKGVFDVAYFLALSVDADVRKDNEQALLDRYHQGLIDGGVTGYDRETLFDDYRLEQMLVLGFVTLPFMSAESSTTRDNTTGLADLGEVWTRRMIAVVDDLDLLWLADRTGSDAAKLKLAFERSNARAWATLGETGEAGPRGESGRTR